MMIDIRNRLKNEWDCLTVREVLFTVGNGGMNVKCSESDVS